MKLNTKVRETIVREICGKRESQYERRSYSRGRPRRDVVENWTEGKTNVVMLSHGKKQRSYRAIVPSCED